ncbi:hypothetical protein H4R21_002825 [Coemansia helicoidea]|uniref:Uncharacterized protein n=1 Tax=Coemansia helicoidea TaxID=1286919 RepID=A0ACC1L5F5_9FUNG|nr:hypothetical protein H4R21_002825 [Coemansia helicoidea]
MDEYFSPEHMLHFDSAFQQQQPPPLTAISSTRSLPNLADFQTPTPMSAGLSFAASFSGASVPCTPAQPFAGFNVPATAPLLLGAYDSLLGTPAMPADTASLFAPLDEIRSRESAQADDLIMQLASADPGFRRDLVHALVNQISSVYAYHPVSPMAPPTPATLSPEALMVQGPPAAAASSAAMPSLEASLLPWSAALESQAPFVDSLLALLGPVHATPAASAASPGVASLVSPVMAPADVFRTPMLPAIAEESADEDAPLAATLGDAPCGAKRAREDDGEDEDGARQTGAGKMYYCDICNRGFSRQYNMRTHRRTHDPHSVAARPHQCRSCPRSFTRKHDLDRHQVLHDDTDAFKCAVCARGFARLDVLERHANAVHKGAM